MAPPSPSNFKFGTQLGFGTSLPENNVLDQDCRGSGPREHPKKVETPYLFLQPLKLATEKLVHSMSLGLPCQTQALRKGSELRQYHSPPQYDDDATVYFTCHQKLTGTQISRLSGIKQNI